MILFLFFAFIVLWGLSKYFIQISRLSARAHAQEMERLKTEKCKLDSINAKQKQQVELAQKIIIDYNLTHLEISKLMFGVIRDNCIDEKS